MINQEKKPVRTRCIPQIVSPKWLTPSEKVGFLDLPGEIRNKIYRLVLVQHPGPYGCELISSIAPPALTLVNKQTFAEALPVFYAENTFYLLLWARGEGPTGQDSTDFHRFTRMVEYFGRPTTSTKDQKPMLHYIKNIVVQVRNSTSNEPGIYSDLRDRSWGRSIYNHLSIRAGQQSLTYETDPARAGEAFDPARYRWTVGDVSTPAFCNTAIVKEACHLLSMSFVSRTQPFAMTLGRLRTELDGLYGPLRLMKDLKGTRPLGPVR